MNRKNVLFICTDHWPAALLGCHGNETIMTPTLDSLARDGIDFQQCYSTCPVCIPARRSLMTGVFPKTHGDRVYSDTMEMPNLPTLAQSFKAAGYQTMGVGKLHVYPQRNRIGFDDVILVEEGRYEFGTVDDYQIWLGEKGYVGEEFNHCMGSNTYYTRPWHLDEQAHPSVWATQMMAKQIKRKDPTRPGFFYISYQFPHPPLVPLQSYLDMYDQEEFDTPPAGSWVNDQALFQALGEQAAHYDERDIKRALRAFYAQCTLIDHQIRYLIGTLRECNLLDDTIIVFTSDHGDMLFNHGMVAKRLFYEQSTHIPLILSGRPLEDRRGEKNSDLVCLEDLMPTLLDLCGIPIPESVEGLNICTKQKREYLYGECGEGEKATRMIRWESYKLIYYPWGNTSQLFDLSNDPKELQDLAQDPLHREVLQRMQRMLIDNLYGSDLRWLEQGVLAGIPERVFVEKPQYGLYNQRGLHWPAPSGYANIGKNV
jgi:arylsulfatase A-like enzyme